MKALVYTGTQELVYRDEKNPSESIVSKIKKLFDLHKSGALNEEEFQLAKDILLTSET